MSKKGDGSQTEPCGRIDMTSDWRQLLVSGTFLAFQCFNKQHNIILIVLYGAMAMAMILYSHSRSFLHSFSSIIYIRPSKYDIYIHLFIYI